MGCKYKQCSCERCTEDRERWANAAALAGAMVGGLIIFLWGMAGVMFLVY